MLVAIPRMTESASKTLSHHVQSTAINTFWRAPYSLLRFLNLSSMFFLKIQWNESGLAHSINDRASSQDAAFSLLWHELKSGLSFIITVEKKCNACITKPLLCWPQLTYRVFCMLTRRSASGTAAATSHSRVYPLLSSKQSQNILFYKTPSFPDICPLLLALGWFVKVPITP